MANTTVNIDIQVQSKSLQQLEEELQDINEQLKQVPIGSQAFEDLSKEAQGLTKDLNKANEAAEGFTDDKKFMAADGAIKLLGGSLAGVVGTLGTLGVESEAFGEFEKKAASAIAVAIGLKDISEGFNQIAKSGVLASAKAKLFGLTTRQALIATGIGAFVVALGAVVAYWDDIVAGVENFGKKVPFVGKAIEAIKSGFDSIVEAFRPVLEFLGILPDAAERANMAVIETNNVIIEQGDRQLALLEAQGASAEALYNKKKELLEAELDNLKRTEADKEEIYAKETELLVLQAKEQKRIQDEAQAERDKQAQIREEKRLEEEQRLKDEADQAIQDEKDRQQAILDIQNEYAERKKEDEAVTYEAKVALEKERALLELEELNATEEQKANIILYYNDLLKQAREQDALELKEKRDQQLQEEIDAKTEAANKELELEQLKLQGKAQAVEAVAELAGRESAVGRALLAFKQALALQETLLDIKRITFKGTQAVGEAAVDAASNVSASSKIGFPQNLITIAAAIAQGVALVGAVKGAVGKTKAAGAGTSASLPSFAGAEPPVQSAPPQNIVTQAPQTFDVSPTVRAYVLSGDVSSNQEADAKLNTKRTII